MPADPRAGLGAPRRRSGRPQLPVRLPARDLARRRRQRLGETIDLAFGGVPDDVVMRTAVLRGEPGPVLVTAACEPDDLIVVGAGRRGPARADDRPAGSAGTAWPTPRCPVIAVPPAELAQACARLPRLGAPAPHRGPRGHPARARGAGRRELPGRGDWGLDRTSGPAPARTAGRPATQGGRHATATGRGTGQGPRTPGRTARALPEAAGRPAAEHRQRRAPPGADLQGHRGDDQVLPGVPRLPAGRAGGEPGLRRVQPLLLRHRQPQPARVLRLPRPRAPGVAGDHRRRAAPGHLGHRRPVRGGQEALEQAGVDYLGPDRGADNSMYFRDPNGVGLELYREELGKFEGEQLLR